MNSNLLRMEEKHYTIGELAKMWGFSIDTVRRMFANEPGVITTRLKGRQHVRIPKSVAERVYTRVSKI